MLGELFWMLFGGGYAAKEVLSEKGKKLRCDKYMEEHGYNIEKQFEVTHLAMSADAKDREEFSRRLGRPYVYKDYWSHRDAVKEIAQKEGWAYYDSAKVHNDPEYQRIMGIKKK